MGADVSTQNVWTLEFSDGVDVFADKAALCKHLRLEYAEIINLSLEDKIDDFGALSDDELVALVKSKVSGMPIGRRSVWTSQSVDQYKREDHTREPVEPTEEPAPFLA
jgi:hypothetical protein